jgi:putative nucleotidyltransferase with HDIG domain
MKIYFKGGSLLNEIRHVSLENFETSLQLDKISIKLLNLLKGKDENTFHHSIQVGKLIEQFATHLSLKSEQIQNIYRFGLLHDIGKLGVKRQILEKPTPLSKEEFGKIQLHSQIGAQILRTKDFQIADWIHKHHEWWNGSGYPLGLKENEIPFECRLISIADAYHAMTNNRPYRKAMSHLTALSEIIKGSGIQFDPHLVKAFINMVELN